MHSPQRQETVFIYDAPWEGWQSAYVTVMKDDDLYRMYYRAGGDYSREYAAYAESTDGIAWTRPVLNLFSDGSSTNNNIIWSGEKKAYWECHNFTPFKDENPNALPSQKYKAVTLSRRDIEGETRKILMGFVSPDGIHWSRIKEDPIIIYGSFDSQNVAFWDTNLNKYVCYSRTGIDGYRSVQRCTSDDFMNWTAPVPLDLGNTAPEHFYTNAIKTYFRAPKIYIGLPMRFVPERTIVGEDQRVVDALSDAVMISSHDGVNFSRYFMEAFIRPGLDQYNWGGGHGNQTPAWGLIPLNDEEISIYWLEEYKYYLPSTDAPKLRRGTIRTDGFASVNAPYRGGEFTTKLMSFMGSASPPWGRK